MNIHKTAVIGSKADLASDVEVGPYTVIEDNVKVGRGSKIMAHAHLCSGAEIGEHCEIHMGAVIGHTPQILGFDKSIKSGVIIGKRNIFREYVSVHRSSKAGGKTIIGDDNYFMGFSHVAHDCIIANNIIVCNNSLLAGHVEVEDRVFIAGSCGVHQLAKIGKLAMIGGLSRVSKDVPPYMILENDSVIVSYNLVGLRRAGYDAAARAKIKWAYKVLYKEGHSVSHALKLLEAEKHKDIKYLIDFIKASKRGICRHKSQNVQTYGTQE
ncbi:MAG: acyl-ACP--UDP-N-acetylglucosamine O-acyltransferase [Candidatus Omnitrophota bacterium]